MNVLMLDEKRVLVDANESSIQKLFESLGEFILSCCSILFSASFKILELENIYFFSYLQVSRP